MQSPRWRRPGLPCPPHPRPRLHECARLVNAIQGRSIHDIFGSPDDLKVRSSMTLFGRATDDNRDFVALLDKYYGGEEDPLTLKRLR
ncbi:hypothetical protein I552_6397 [Mycobacterium xenopi 3993]|nr:hypothetical protein I552_6397 [Mycobacterium xenopi 3993]